METSFNEARTTFEEWICNMAAESGNQGSTQMVYGLVAVGIFLIGYHEYEQQRSDLMGLFGLDWFELNSESWRVTKSQIYSGPSILQTAV